MSVDRQFRFGCLAAKGVDATGTYELSRYFLKGVSCEKNESLADELVERAADLGSIVAYCALLDTLRDPKDKVKLLCNIVVVVPHLLRPFALNLRVLIWQFESDGSCGDVIFEAGEVLEGSIDPEEDEVFGQKHGSDLDLFKRVLAMHEGWCKAARAACVAWILIAKRTGFHKDVRKMISKIVWKARSEARGAILLEKG